MAGGCSPDRLCEQRQETGRKLWEHVLSVVTLFLYLSLGEVEGKLQSEYLKLPPSSSSPSVYAFKLLIALIVLSSEWWQICMQTQTCKNADLESVYV